MRPPGVPRPPPPLLSGAALLLLLASGCGAASTVQGAGDGGADAGADGGLCGDPQVLARYADCRAATREAPCEDAGGTWTLVGLAPEPECQCPTGQGGCPCTSSADCLSACVGEMPGSWEEGCDGIAAHCSPISITVGCWCWFGEGMSGPICVD